MKEELIEALEKIKKAFREVRKKPTDFR